MSGQRKSDVAGLYAYKHAMHPYVCHVKQVV